MFYVALKKSEILTIIIDVTMNLIRGICNIAYIRVTVCKKKRNALFLYMISYFCERKKMESVHGAGLPDAKTHQSRNPNQNVVRFLIFPSLGNVSGQYAYSRLK